MKIRSIRSKKLGAGLTAAALVVLLVGCGGPKGDKNVGTVSGQVTHHGGKPLTDAVITFYAPKQGTSGFAPLGGDGKYRIETPLKAGDYQVCVAPPEAVDPADGSPPPKPVQNADIPAKYRDYRTSGLTTTVKAGANEYNVELK